MALKVVLNIPDFALLRPPEHVAILKRGGTTRGLAKSIGERVMPLPTMPKYHPDLVIIHAGTEPQLATTTTLIDDEFQDRAYHYAVAADLEQVMRRRDSRMGYWAGRRAEAATNRFQLEAAMDRRMAISEMMLQQFLARIHRGCAAQARLVAALQTYRDRQEQFAEEFRRYVALLKG